MREIGAGVQGHALNLLQNPEVLQAPPGHNKYDRAGAEKRRNPIKTMRILPAVFGCCLAALAVHAKEAVVHLNEDFEKQPLGALREKPPVRRAVQVSVVDGGGKVGSGHVAHFNDASVSEGGAMEFNVGAGGLDAMRIRFDLLNQTPGELEGKDAIIFGVGTWNPSRGMLLNANARRAFGLEFHRSGTRKTLVLRVGKSARAYATYEMAEVQHVEIWVNGNDAAPLAYGRPDTGEEALVGANSVVVWVNGNLFGSEPPEGLPMQKEVSGGNGNLGRIGFDSTTRSTVDFLIDNLRVADPSGESRPAVSGNSGETTPQRLASAETFRYRTGKDAMNLFVFKPKGWKASDRRSALVYFFGGGWTKGTPLKSASWARWAAGLGMVGIVPDYRTKNRFGTSPLESVADGRAAFNWVVEHADELGIDPKRIAVGGNSAGGHIALWTAIGQTPPGSDPAEAPKVRPAALFLSSAVTDTSPGTGYTPSRFGKNALALSPVDQLDTRMPPVLMFHACDDRLVDYRTAVAFHNRLKSTGNECRLVSVPRGGHGFSGKYPEWKQKVRTQLESFFQDLELLPAVAQRPAP